MFHIFKISGDSLYPFYHNAQRVFCRKIFAKTNVTTKDTVLFKKDHHGLMIKKVKSVENDRYFVEGTDPLSIDSRNFGTLQHSELLYKVLFKF